MYKFITFLFIFCVLSGVANAAVVLSLTQESSSAATDEVRVLVNVDTDKKTINGFDVRISYNESDIKFVGYDSTLGINPVWVAFPRAVKNEITFSGIIPGGASVTYDPNNLGNEKLSLVELVFQAKKIGATDLKIEESSIFLNDGLGTKIEHENKNITLTIKSTTTMDDKNTDITPPQNLTISLIPKSKDANTPYLVAFESSDESGIAYYKLKQHGNWQEVSSPYPVKQKLLPYRTYIRAYDVYGNMNESSVVIPPLVPIYVYGILVGLFLAGFYIYKLVK